MKRKAPLNDERGFCLRIQSRPKGRSLGRRISSGSAAAGEFDGLADVGGGREFHQGGLGIGGDVEVGDEFAHRFLGDAVLAAGEGLELLVRMRHTVAAHHGLNGFGEDFPGVVEVGGDDLLVDLELAEAARQGVVADEAVAEGDAEVAQDGGVRQVALPAGDRELAGEMIENGVGEAEIAFGVFEVDRVDLCLLYTSPSPRD